MQPRTVGAEEKLMRPGSFYSLDNVVEAPNPRGICVYIRIAHKLFNHAFVRLPVVGEAPQVRNNKIYVGILLGKQIDHVRLPAHIYEHRYAKSFCGFAHFSRRHSFKAVNLHAAKSPAQDGFGNHREDPPRIPQWMNKREANQAVLILRYDPGNLEIGFRKIAMKERKDHRPGDARSPRPPKILIERRICVPRGSHGVSLARMTVTINDHLVFLLPRPNWQLQIQSSPAGGDGDSR